MPKPGASDEPTEEGGSARRRHGGAPRVHPNKGGSSERVAPNAVNRTIGESAVNVCGQ